MISTYKILTVNWYIYSEAIFYVKSVHWIKKNRFCVEFLLHVVPCIESIKKNTSIQQFLTFLRQSVSLIMLPLATWTVFLFRMLQSQNQWLYSIQYYDTNTRLRSETAYYTTLKIIRTCPGYTSMWWPWIWLNSAKEEQMFDAVQGS